VANPAAIIKGPKRVSGRRRQATSPAKMNGKVAQLMSTSRRERW
jgi:hypothetical protein